MIVNKINWFPGHMKKATDDIKKKIDFVDLIIEVVDARCISSSSNTDLLKIINNKNYLKIALKSDLSTLNEQYDKNLIITNTKNKKNRLKIINVFYEIFQEKINKLKNKGLINPQFSFMVIGLPNVGKSSLINFLKAKNNLIVKNMPGVTKKQRIVSINDNFNLIDTPGILLKNIDDINVAYKLSLINCIKVEILPIEEVVKYGFDYLFSNSYLQLKTFYDIQNFDNYYDFLKLVANRLKFISKNGQLDINRTIYKVFFDLIETKITKVNYDF